MSKHSELDADIDSDLAPTVDDFEAVPAAPPSPPRYGRGSAGRPPRRAPAPPPAAWPSRAYYVDPDMPARHRAPMRHRSTARWVLVIVLANHAVFAVLYGLQMAPAALQPTTLSVMALALFCGFTFAFMAVGLWALAFANHDCSEGNRR